MILGIAVYAKWARVFPNLTFEKTVIDLRHPAMDLIWGDENSKIQLILGVVTLRVGLLNWLGL